MNNLSNINKNTLNLIEHEIKLYKTIISKTNDNELHLEGYKKELQNKINTYNNFKNYFNQPEENF